MCEICLKSPCDTRCPNAPDEHSVFVCSGCGDSIYDGDDYWDILGEQWCEKCIKDMRRIAVYDPY